MLRVEPMRVVWHLPIKPTDQSSRLINAIVALNPGSNSFGPSVGSGTSVECSRGLPKGHPCRRAARTAGASLPKAHLFRRAERRAGAGRCRCSHWPPRCLPILPQPHPPRSIHRAVDRIVQSKEATLPSECSSPALPLRVAGFKLSHGALASRLFASRFGALLAMAPLPRRSCAQRRAGGRCGFP